MACWTATSTTSSKPRWPRGSTATSPAPRRHETIAAGGGRLGERVGGSGRMTEDVGEPAVSPAASGYFRLEYHAPGYSDPPYPQVHALSSQSRVFVVPAGGCVPPSIY